MTFDPAALRVNDKVGIRPSGMADRLYSFGTVSKVTKTQVTVTYDRSGNLNRFMRSTGRVVGCLDSFRPSTLVSVTRAMKANAAIRPRLIKRRDGQKLADITMKTPSSEFHQRQLDMALVALNERYAGDLPPLKADPDEWEKAAQISEQVLVKAKGFAGLWFGQYAYAIEEWRLDNVHGRIEVVEWYPLPGGAE